MTDAQIAFFREVFLDFLQINFTPWTLEQFSALDSEKIYQKLETHIPKELLLISELAVIHSIENFFNNLGKIEVKVEPYKNISITTNIDPNTLKALELLQEHQANFDIKRDSNLLIINESITATICDQLKLKKEDFRKAMRATLPLIEDLGKSHAILFGKSRITVRTHLDKASSEKRYLGLPPEELEALVQKYFNDVQKEMPELVNKALQKRPIFQTLSNQEFETTHIKILQEELITILGSRSQQDKGILKALANYILRQQFHDLHMLLAQQLIQLVVERNPKAEQFLFYYTQGTISINGQKFMIPPLKDSEGKLWSIANITSTAVQYQNYQQALQKKDTLLNTMEETLNNVDEEIILSSKSVHSVKDDFEKNLQKLKQTGKKITEIRHQFQSQRERMDFQYETKLSSVVAELELQEKKEMQRDKELEKSLIKSEKVFADLKYKKSATIDRYNTEVDKLEEFQQLNKEIITKHELMLFAVMKALMSKKSRY